MTLNLGPELERFRLHIRAWIAENRPAGLEDVADWRPHVHNPAAGLIPDEVAANPIYQEWDRRLQGAGLICAHWPEEAGGRGLTRLEMVVFTEECHRAGVPRIDRGHGERLVGPSLLTHGTDEQKAHFLPRIVSGEDTYCQGFSEPNAGSDLAALETRGEVDGDELVVTGQKVWTSRAEQSSMMHLLCRTEPGSKRHRGLAYVLLPLTGANVEIRPIRNMAGGAEFAEVWLDGARAPLFNVVGGLGNGWRVAMTTLGNERGGDDHTMLGHVAYAGELHDLIEAARERGLTDDPLVRQRLADAWTHVEIMRFGALRTAARLASHRDPGPESSVTKIFWSEYHRRLSDLAVALLGAEELVRPEGDGYPLDRWQQALFDSRAMTIAGGSSEIQRRIIAERALGLPREPV